MKCWFMSFLLGNTIATGDTHWRHRVYEGKHPVEYVRDWNRGHPCEPMVLLFFAELPAFPPMEMEV